MDLSATTFSFSSDALIFGTAILFGLLLWWFIRKRQQRIWLPTVRILELESRRLPKLQWRWPPFIPFLAFLLAALALLAFSFKPTMSFLVKTQPQEVHSHIYVDLSPSASAHVSIDNYSQRVINLWEELSQQGRVSISTSSAPDFVVLASLTEARKFSSTLGFHRAGLRLGTAMSEAAEGLTEINRLFVLSDGDKFSWSDFNWQYLGDHIKVFLVDVRRTNPPANIYIGDATFTSAPGSNLITWDVELLRTSEQGEANSELSAWLDGRMLATAQVGIPDGRGRQIAQISWPSQQQEQANTSDDALTFRLTPERPDALQLDNQFNTFAKGSKQNALLIASPAGEMHLEDPTHHLQKSLEVLGFRVRRIDGLKQPGPAASVASLWLAVGGSGGGLDEFCPRSIVATKEPANEDESLPTVWLIPSNPKADFKELCACYARLVPSTSTERREPAYCEEIVSRERYAGVLRSLGAKQIGGNTEDPTTAIAWRMAEPDSGLQVVAFTLPLTPLRSTGVNHAALPMLVKELLEVQGLLGNAGLQARSSWPRVADIAASRGLLSPRERSAQIEFSNVPTGESLLHTLEIDQLPPTWLGGGYLRNGKLAGQEEKLDPLPWIFTCALVILAMIGIEATYWGVLGLRSLLKIGVLLLLLPTLQLGESAQAQVKINRLGYAGHSAKPFNRLTREVAERTSIELDPAAQEFSAYSENLLFEPWIWVQGIDKIRDPEGGLRTDLVNWVKRGGFLVIEGAPKAKELEELTSKAFAYAPLNPRWKPIPPDHELMRSFHLLDSLPLCSSQGWQGFHFDGRLAVLAIPIQLLKSLEDEPRLASCQEELKAERTVRVFVNLLMVVLATDYKKDQIHLPEILKRLR